MAKVNRSTAEHYVWGEVCDGWRLLDTRNLCVIEERMPPGAREVRHRHARATQLFYVLDGTLTLEVEDTRLDLSAGDACHVRPGQVHEARNDSAAAVRFLVISSPDTRGDRQTC